MGFVNDGPWANFVSVSDSNDNPFQEVEFVTSSSPSSYNDNIKTEKGAIFIMEVYQLNPSNIPYYKLQSVEVNTSTGLATVSAIGGNGTYNSHLNSSSDGIVLGFSATYNTLKTYMRVWPIVGNVEILG